MAFNSAKITLTRYRIEGAPRKLNLETLNKGFRKFRAAKLRLDAPRMLSYGWDIPVFGEDALSPGDDFDMSHCQVASGFLMRFRAETKRVNKSLLQFVFSQRLREMAAAGQELKRQERKALHDELQEDLLAKTLPELKFVDCLWLTERSEFWLFSSAKRDQEIAEKLFRESFTKPLGCNFNRIMPPLLGTSHGEDQRVSAQRYQAIMRTTPSQLYAGDYASH